MKLGVFQNNGSPLINNDLITVCTFTDIQSLRYARSGTVRILEHYGFGDWSEAYIRSRFALAEKYSNSIDGLIFMLQEELYKPSRTPQTNANTARGDSYTLEDVTIPAMPGNEDEYFLALLKAWKNLCIRLGKMACICGSPAVCADDRVWDYMYGASGVDFIARNFDMLILYHYPYNVVLAEGASCIQMNGMLGKCDAKSYIDFWRKRGFRGKINYIIVTEFPDVGKKISIDVVEADFKNAYDNLNDDDIISTYPYANGVFTNSDAVPRLITLYNEYNGDIQPTTGDKNNMTLYFFGDAEPTNTAELIKDFNAAVSLSPTGAVGACFAMGDMTKDGGGMNYTIQALNGSSLKDVPSYFVIGNHEYNSKSSTYPLIQGKLGTQYILNYFADDTTKNTYSFTIGEIHVAVLNIYYNNSTGKVSQAMFDWLAADMAGFTGYKVAIAHDPMYPTKKHVGNSLDADKAMRDKLQTMFIANHVNVFLGGHVHYSSVQNIGGVYHVCTGVIGPGTNQGEDPFASLNYIYIDELGNLRLVRKQDSGNSWANPKVITHTVGTGGAVPPDPVETWACQMPYDGMEISNLGNTRPNPACDPAIPSGDMTLEQLAGYPNYVAIEGKIIDMTSVFPHNGHVGGKDLTVELKDKHGVDKIAGYPVIGNLITDIPPPPPPTETVDPDLRPVLVSMIPTTCKVGDDVTVTLTGTDFNPTAYPNFYINDVFVDHGVFVSGTSTQIVVTRKFVQEGTVMVKVNNRNQLKSKLALPFIVILADVSPEETFICEEPRNGWEIGTRGTRRQNPICNPTVPPATGEFDLTDLVKVEVVLKTISDALDTIRKK